MVGPALLGKMTPAKTLENICVVTDYLTEHLAMEWNQLGEEKERKKERVREGGKKNSEIQYGPIKQGSEMVGPAYVLPKKKRCKISRMRENQKRWNPLSREGGRSSSRNCQSRFSS